MCKCNNDRTCERDRGGPCPKSNVNTPKPECAFLVGDVCARRNDPSRTYKVVLIGHSEMVCERDGVGYMIFNSQGYCHIGFYIDPPKRTKTMTKVVFYNPSYPARLVGVSLEGWNAHYKYRGYVHKIVTLEVSE